MKCPHCNQEHPNGFQFCPATGKKIELMKACTYPDCPDYGKCILPPDSRFCPTCGRPLEGVIDWNKLFPVFGVTLGETNIYDLAKASRIKRCDAGLFCNVHNRDVGVVQRREDSFINSIWVQASAATSFPKRWQSIFGLRFGMPIGKCKNRLKARGFNCTVFQGDKKGYGYCVFITLDNKYIIKIIFENGSFDSIEVFLYTCPYCNSNAIKVSYEKDDGITLLCQSCGREWGVIYDVVADEDNENEEDSMAFPSSNYHKYRITNECVACGTCLEECPVGAISEGRIYAIDRNTCVGCGTCASICPNEAIQSC